MYYNDTLDHSMVELRIHERSTMKEHYHLHDLNSKVI